MFVPLVLKDLVYLSSLWFVFKATQHKDKLVLLRNDLKIAVENMAGINAFSLLCDILRLPGNMENAKRKRASCTTP